MGKLPIATGAFAAGMCVATALQILYNRRQKKSPRENAEATVEQSENSLFYARPCTFTDHIPKSRSFLPAEFYSQMVRDCVLTCVDVLLVRTNPQTKIEECLLVERATEPVKGVWWWPGGRMFKGETFFSCALRKVREETGISSEDATCVQVLGYYNTFFPTSAWDTEEDRGTQTVQPIVLVVLGKGASHDVSLDNTSERYRWIEVDAAKAEERGEDKYVLEGLKRLEAWNETYGKKW